MEDLMKHVKVLSEDIGPRGSATPREKEAASYLAGIMRSAGLEVGLEEFKAPHTFSWTYLLYYLLGLCGALLIGGSNGLALFLGMFALLGFILENYTVPVLSRVVPQGRSQNVIGKLHPSGSVLGRAVIVAHYDSSRSGPNFSPSAVRTFRQTFLLMTGALVAVPVLALVKMIPLAGLFGGWVAVVRVLVVVILCFPVLSLVYRETMGQYTPGANDNASGVSAMLGVAEELAHHRPRGVEVWFVATGCEESGSGGMLDLLKRHKSELRGAVIVNLDNLGKGALKYITGEGMLFSLPAGARALQLAEAAAREMGDRVSPHCYRLMSTDALPALVRGLDAVSVMAFDDRGLLPNWHWYTDIPAHVDGENLKTAAGFVAGMVAALDENLAGANKK
ncbi:hypothetical protein SY88_04430 [Clostridiales bacterium PH28_bin88]|nr:hypothetical protein SY88_04430 [Clostridiales bacterium PH28_bin88]